MIVKFRMNNERPTATLFGHTWVLVWDEPEENDGIPSWGFDDDSWDEKQEAAFRSLSEEEDFSLCRLWNDVPWLNHLKQIEQVCRTKNIEVNIGRQVRAWIEDGEFFFTLDTEADYREGGKDMWDDQFGELAYLKKYS